MNALVTDSTGACTSTVASHPYPSYSHHRRPNTAPNLEWRQEVQLHGGGGGVDRHDDAMCIDRGQMGNSSWWNPSVLHHHSSSVDRDEEPSVEWLHQSDEDDDMQESAAAVPLSWYHSRVPSASTSMDSLGLRHFAPFPVPADYSAISPTYDRTSFCPTNFTGSQHELSELDISQISPLTGNPLINWQSPQGFSYYGVRDDEIGSLLGQKRPREGESDDSDMVNGCKRRRRLGMWG